MMNYNTFHLQNNKIQNKLIRSSNYTYQTLIKLTKKYFHNTGTIFDFGCGVGVIDLFLADKGHIVKGIDISKRAILLANSSKSQLRIKSANFICIDITKFNSKTKCDYFICSEVLEHLPFPDIFLSRIKKLVKNGGLGIVSVPSVGAPLFRWGLLRDFDKRVGHLRRYDKSSLRSLLTYAGFEIVKEYETEGLFRNLIYTNHHFGWIVRFIKFPISIIINLIDLLLLKIFGSSNYYFVIKNI